MQIFVGAAGATCPLGNTLEGIFTEMATGKTGIKSVADAYGLGKEEFLGTVPDELVTVKESTKLRGMIATCMVESQAGLKDPEILSSKETRVILCTTKGEIDKLETEGTEAAQLYHLSSYLQEKYKLAHTPILISSACVSGLLGVINAARMIQAGAAKHVVVIGADLVTRFTLSGFISFYATATSPSKPYDKTRDGINLGEAAASVVVSSDATIFNSLLGKYLGGASANDANHISGPSRTGEGLYRSVSKAFNESGMKPESVDFISAHGTATAFNDEMEAIAFDRLALNDVPLNSMKGYLGHTLGAAGLLETLIGLQSLKEGLLLKSLGFENAGISKRINVLAENKKGKFKRMLKTSSGFGGSNAAAVFEGPQSPTSTSSVQAGGFSARGFAQPLPQSVAKSPLGGFRGPEAKIWGLKAHTTISPKGVYHNGEQLVEGKTDKTELLREAYQTLGMSYPKFFKMDTLSKLGIIGTEPFFGDGKLKEKYKDDEIAVLLANRSSSMESDVAHHQNYTEGKASPAVFVYTLPNIVVGEICIRHQLFSESNFYIFEKFDAAEMLMQAQVLLSESDCKACILGWVESFEDNFKAVFFLLEKDGETEATEDVLKGIYSGTN